MNRIKSEFMNSTTSISKTHFQPAATLNNLLHEFSGERLMSGAELALRWGCSAKKLAHDRLAGRGPSFVKLGRLCRYRLST